MERPNFLEAALAIPCPTCQAGPGAICRTGRGAPLRGKPHQARKKSARDLWQKIVRERDPA